MPLVGQQQKQVMSRLLLRALSSANSWHPLTAPGSLPGRSLSPPGSLSSCAGYPSTTSEASGALPPSWTQATSARSHGQLACQAGSGPWAGLWGFPPRMDLSNATGSPTPPLEKPYLAPARQLHALAAPVPRVSKALGHSQLRVPLGELELLSSPTTPSSVIPPENRRAFHVAASAACHLPSPRHPSQQQKPTFQMRLALSGATWQLTMPRSSVLSGPSSCFIPSRSFAKRPKKWHGDPWRFVKADGDMPVPYKQPNEGATRGRNHKRRYEQRERFKQAQHDKRREQTAAARKAKAAKHFLSWRANFARSIMKKKAATAASAQAAVA